MLKEKMSKEIANACQKALACDNDDEAKDHFKKIDLNPESLVKAAVLSAFTGGINKSGDTKK